jgi:hypothetical protein
MRIFSARRGAGLCKTLLAAIAAAAFPFAATAKDLPPTPEGAQKLNAVFAAYLGKPADGAPSPVAVVPEGDHYAVTVDLAALAAPLQASGFSLDSAAIKYALTEQSDGTWRVVGDSLPSISAHAKDTAVLYNFEGYKFDGIFDPTIAAFRTAQGGFTTLSADIHGPGLNENFTLGATQATQTGTPAANGAATAAAHEEIADLSGKASIVPGGAKAAPDAAPVPISIQSPKMLADISLEGAPFRKALDLWAFVVAHPDRPALAANEPAFKDLLRALLPGDFKLAEKVEIQKLAVGAPQGVFGLSNGKFGFAGAASPGPKGSIEYHFAADGLALPPGLLPPAIQDLAPTAFNIDVKASGLDFVAGAEEAISDLHFAGDGPVIAEADKAKILAKIKGSAPLIVTLSPSHIVAPQLDATLEGEVHLEGVRPNGVLKIHVRNFDKTVAALKALGPLASPQMIGGLALAKTLAKTESDGALIWIAEYGADGAIKVNGLPLGKAP